MRTRNLAEYANVDPVLGVLVARRLATWHELRTVYSYRDALDMAEIVTVGNYNEWAAAEEAKRRGNNR